MPAQLQGHQDLAEAKSGVGPEERGGGLARAEWHNLIQSEIRLRPQGTSMSPVLSEMASDNGSWA